MARLTARIAAAGYPCFRFDRRGVGDSDGDDGGYAGAAADIAAAAAAFRREAPTVERVIGLGLCDGATSLALHLGAAGVDGIVLINPWVVEPSTGLPPPAAIRRRYVSRLTSREGWRRLLSGRVDLRKAARGVGELARRRPSGLSAQVAAALTAGRIPIDIIVASGDATGIAFLAEYTKPPYVPVRSGGARLHVRDSRSHTLLHGGDADWLFDTVLVILKRGPLQR